VFLGGSVNGAQILEVRLANELHRRGFPVHVWWVVDKPDQSPLTPGIPEKWLFHSFRYATGRTSSTMDIIGRLTSSVLSERWRSTLSQRIPWTVAATLRGMIKTVCEGVHTDQRLIRHFARELTDAGVTHTLQTVELMAPFVEAARSHVPHPLKYMVQYQGYETYAPYASKMGLEQQLYQRLREVTQASGFPAISVSDSYSERIHQEVGLPLADIQVAEPGIPLGPPMDSDAAKALVQQHFPNYNSSLPLVAYLGRRDSEKGIDLLLYAAKILRERGFKFQLAICGPTAFGSRYSVACSQIARVMRLPVLSSDFLSNEVRSALFRTSHCIVYPSIHAEPFGMVPVEAMAQGTPVLVPDTGGVSQLPFLDDQQGGLIFRSWDSGDLAGQLDLLLTNRNLHDKLSKAAPQIAAHYSVERVADRYLDLFELPHRPDMTISSIREVAPIRRAA
jgi:glycosyltransferase involved in cell wall biosynthesis